MYGTYNNGNMTPAPRKIVLGDWVILNPTPDQYEAAGYLPVVYTEPPEAPEGFYPMSGWEEQDGEIVQVWRLEELPPEEPEDIAWDVWQGRHITAGTVCRVDERRFTATVDHDAAWNKRPLTGANWEAYWKEGTP